MTIPYISYIWYIRSKNGTLSPGTLHLTFLLAYVVHVVDSVEFFLKKGGLEALQVVPTQKCFYADFNAFFPVRASGTIKDLVNQENDELLSVLTSLYEMSNDKTY